jgi:hypothetical protein
VSRDVRFEEDRVFARSLESRVGVENDAELPIAVSEGAQPQSSGTPVSGVTRLPCTTSGSQSEHVQSDGAQTSEGAQTSGSQSVEMSLKQLLLGRVTLLVR